MIADAAARHEERTPQRLLVVWSIGVGAALLVLGCLVLVLPTSTHQDMPEVGEAIFFDCGGALDPGARPAEEPGVTACREVNDSMLRLGLALVAGGAALGLGGVLRLRDPRPRR